MTVPRQSVAAGALALVALLTSACGECADCNGFGVYTAWIAARATAVAGTPVPDVAIRAESPLFNRPWTDTTDITGITVLELQGAFLPASVQVAAVPPSGFGAPASQTIAVITGDTAVVQFTLEPMSSSDGGV